ncbi:MAG: NADH-quinone oxidoreductase subunit K [Anaerolineaceae bacterium]|jgi:NADH:ubiquinone oxidoreductase subunit K|nr:NADH-quinone oxidoreductase subunit K [Anaerolineaceae bacterium]
MNLPIPLIVLITILCLAGIGLYCLLITRNLIKVVIALQLIVKGAVLAFILAGNMTGQLNLAQSMALTVIVADTIVAVVGLALAVQIRLKTGSLDIKSLSSLKR